MNFYSEHGKIVDELLDNVHDWETDGEFWVIHKSGISLWIGNGASHFNGRINSRIDDVPIMSLGKIERRFLYRKAMKIVMACRAEKLFKLLHPESPILKKWKNSHD